MGRTIGPLFNIGDIEAKHKKAKPVKKKEEEDATQVVVPRTLGEMVNQNSIFNFLKDLI